MPIPNAAQRVIPTFIMQVAYNVTVMTRTSYVYTRLHKDSPREIEINTNNMTLSPICLMGHFEKCAFDFGLKATENLWNNAT